MVCGEVSDERIIWCSPSAKDHAPAGSGAAPAPDLNKRSGDNLIEIAGLKHRVAELEDRLPRPPPALPRRSPAVFVLVAALAAVLTSVAWFALLALRAVEAAR